MTNLLQSLSEADAGAFDTYEFQHQVARELNAIWGPSQDKEPTKEFFLRHEQVHAPVTPVKRSTWAIAFTHTFRKSVEGMDKKLQGRALEAIADLSESPLTIKGDTIKPLTGELKGLWRFRVGDYRLVYQPRKDDNLVVLLEFAPRGGAYD